MSTSIGLTDTQRTVLAGRIDNAATLHIGTDDGVLTIEVRDGKEITSTLRCAHALRPIVTTYLLCEPGRPGATIRSAATVETATLCIGHARFPIPFRTAGLVHAWLGRHIDLPSAVSPLPDTVIQALHVAQARAAA